MKLLRSTGRLLAWRYKERGERRKILNNDPHRPLHKPPHLASRDILETETVKFVGAPEHLPTAAMDQPVHDAASSRDPIEDFPALPRFVIEKS